MKECPFRIEGHAIMYENTIVGIIADRVMLEMCGKLVQNAWRIGYLDRQDEDNASRLQPDPAPALIGGAR